jgi:hypothetical protein
MEDGTAYECPDQHTCPLGSTTPTLCEDGKYCSNEDTGTAAFTDDSTAAYESQTTDGGLDCPAGSYCKSGFKADCWSGYLCTTGSDTPTPTSGSVGELCPEGAWCAAGATAKTICLDGTYNPNTGGQDVNDCETCPTGFTCVDTDGTILPSAASCDAGSICGEPNVDCDPGFYCPSGALTMKLCPAGTY